MSYIFLINVMQIINCFWGDVLLSLNQKNTSQNTFNCTTSQLRSKLSSNQDREKRLGRLSLQSDDTGSRNSILTICTLSWIFSWPGWSRGKSRSRQTPEILVYWSQLSREKTCLCNRSSKYFISFTRITVSTWGISKL